MARTVTIARFETYEGAKEAAELLRANHIKCTFDMLPRDLSGALFGVGTSTLGFPLIVAPGDAQRARDVLRGFLDAKWFLSSPDGRHEHAFETASPATLRAHAESLGDDSVGWSKRDCERLADLLEQAGKHQVYDAFHHGWLRDREGTLDGRTLDEWAIACGAVARTQKPG